MKARISLILAASLILPAISQAYQEIDFSRVQRADISDAEYEAVAKTDFKKYFDGSCQKRVVLDLSIVKKTAVKEELKRKLEAKGHQGMLNNLDNSFPLKTIYFTLNTRGTAPVDETKAPFNETAVQPLINKMTGEYQLTLKDLTPLLLSDKQISKQKFEALSVADVSMKESVAPADVIAALEANKQEDLKENDGDMMYMESSYGIDPYIVQAAHTFGKRSVSGLEFKALQLNTLQQILAQTEGKPRYSHMGDLTAMMLGEGLVYPFTPVTAAGTVHEFIDSLPNCK
ncbi:hypothetical protein D3C72_1151020 [compost metagenome]